MGIGQEAYKIIVRNRINSRVGGYLHYQKALKRPMPFGRDPCCFTFRERVPTGKPIRVMRQVNWVWLFFVGGPRRLLRAARQELLDPSKAWWGGRRGRLADRRCHPVSVSLGVVPLVLARFVEVPVRIEVAAGS